MHIEHWPLERLLPYANNPRHRLLCGDSTVITDVERLMAGAKADMVFTDPPYNVAYEGGTKDKLTIQNDKMPKAAFYDFLLATFTSMKAACRPGAAFYVCHGDNERQSFQRALESSGWAVHQCLIWVNVWADVILLPHGAEHNGISVIGAPAADRPQGTINLSHVVAMFELATS